MAGLSMASPPTAQAGHVSCGDTIGPWEYVSLDSDLNCTETPALTVIGPAVLDLNDHTLRCAPNEDSHIGIEIVGWYATVKNGRIENCHEGVVVEGFGYHRVRGLEITEILVNDTGIVVNSNRNRIEDNDVHDNESTGILVNGSYNTLKRNISNSNSGLGFQVSGNRNYLYDNTADGNSGGFIVFGDNNRLIKNTATNNPSRAGFKVEGTGNFFLFNSANENESGFAINGSFNVFLFNSANESTSLDGFVNIRGTSNVYKYNTALDDAREDLRDFTDNCDNNVWEFNTFGTRNQDCIN